ncbi:hypothetical protein SAMN05428949_5677 [Chitinophaga sp. YR627]|nr:hypothetical protein SAMN05428949_5677 [Chitinophaga sp. YR627]
MRLQKIFVCIAVIAGNKGFLFFMKPLVTRRYCLHKGKPNIGALLAGMRQRLEEMGQKS